MTLSSLEPLYILGDTCEALSQFEDGFFHMALTSIPYWGQRSYVPGDLREIGRPHQSLMEYLAQMNEVFAELHRVIDDGGTFWLNVGDTAVGSGGSGGDYNKGGSYEGKARSQQGKAVLSDGFVLPKGQWADVPNRLLHILQEQGWLVRAEVIWDKKTPRREDMKHVRRPLVQHEKIFMLVKTSSYRFFPDHVPESFHTNVWQISPSRRKKAGKAPWPPALVRAMISLSTEKDDIVLDPFVGYCSALFEAKALGRNSVGIDIDEEAVIHALQRDPSISVIQVPETVQYFEEKL